MPQSVVHTRKRGDTNKPLEIDLTPVTLSVAGSTAVFLVRPSGSEVAVSHVATITLAMPPRLTYVPDGTEVWVTTSGRYSFELQVTFPNGKIQTFPEEGFLSIHTVPDLGP